MKLQLVFEFANFFFDFTGFGVENGGFALEECGWRRRFFSSNSF
jgi:hypothetical protein